MKQAVPFFPAQCLSAPALSVAVMVLYALRVTVADDCVEFFEKKIHPVLVEHCYQCHSGESKELQGELRLDVKAGWQLGGDPDMMTDVRNGSREY